MSRQMMVRFPDELFGEIDAAAKRERRPFSAMVRLLVEESLATRTAPEPEQAKELRAALAEAKK